MNFFNLLTSGSSLFNFSLSSSSNPPPITLNASKEISPQQIITEPKDSFSGAPKEGAEGENRAALFTQQQQLINQFMHLNIQLLSRKLENLEHIDRLPRAEEAEAAAETRNAKKKIKKTNSCGHAEREHYAKGMCSNCYHKHGRTKQPWNCPHAKLYANGMCQNCYINSYNRKRREEGKEDKPNDPSHDSEHPSNIKEEEIS